MRLIIFAIYLLSTTSNIYASTLASSQGANSVNQKASAIQDGDHVIRIGIFYTNDLASHLSKEALNQYIERQINAANVALENSGLSIRREVGYVGLYPINNTSVGSQAFLSTIYNSQAAPVFDIRNKFGLDYITILRPHISSQFCGWAYYHVPYAVMEYGGNCISETLGAHEWGHNDGADHDIANSSDTPARAYGRGFNCGGEGTIMSTSNNWNQRHTFYSSPNKSIEGLACGIADNADVTRMLDELKELPNHLGNIRETPEKLAAIRFVDNQAFRAKEGETVAIKLEMVDTNNNVISLDRPASIELVSVADTARGSLDYQEIMQRINFAAGETSKQVNIVINADNEAEVEETFFVRLRHGDIVQPATESLSIIIGPKSVSDEPAKSSGGAIALVALFALFFTLLWRNGKTLNKV